MTRKLIVNSIMVGITIIKLEKDESSFLDTHLGLVSSCPGREILSEPEDILPQ